MIIKRKIIGCLTTFLIKNTTNIDKLHDSYHFNNYSIHRNIDRVNPFMRQTMACETPLKCSGAAVDLGTQYTTISAIRSTYTTLTCEHIHINLIFKMTYGNIRRLVVPHIPSVSVDGVWPCSMQFCAISKLEFGEHTH